MATGRTDVRFETTGQWFDEFIGVPTNPGMKHEPAFKRTLMSIWHIVKRLDKYGATFEQVMADFDVTEDELRAAMAYYQAFPWNVDLRWEPDQE